MKRTSEGIPKSFFCGGGLTGLSGYDKMYPPRKGRVLLHVWWLAHHTPGKIQKGGGEADVEKTRFCRIAILGIRDTGDVFTYHKSVLAARSAPRRLTFFR